MIVVKVGGRVTLREEWLANVLDDVAVLAEAGERIVVVHGGGDAVTEYSRRMGVEPRFVVSPSGVRSRYTGPEELEVYVMVMAGKINKGVTSRLLDRGVRVLGVTGVDCGLVRAERKKRIVIVNERGRPQAIPGGYTGRIVGVDRGCLEALLSVAGVLVVAPLARGLEGEMLNVDGDQAAYSIAVAGGAEALVFLTDAPGVIVGGRVLGSLRAGDVERVVGEIGYGMNRKLLMAKRAVEEGVGKVVIGDARVEAPVRSALEGRNGTTVLP